MSYKPSNPNGQAVMANSEPVVIASNQTAIPITDNAASLTVDAPVTAPVFVRLSDGTSVITALPITDNGGSVTVDGTVAATQSGTWTVQPGNTANTTPWVVKPAESLGSAVALGALNAEVTHALNGNLGAAATITATAAPTGIVLTAYASYDGGTNWTVTQFFNSANGDVIPTLSAFATGNAYSLSAGDGATHIKVRATSWTSGSVTVRLSSSNSQGLVNLKATAVHDDPVGSFILQTGAYASSTAPTAVAVGDAVRLWATTSGALNIADGGGSVTVDGTFWQATQPVSIATMPTTPVTGTFWQATQPVSLASVPSHAVTNAGTFAVQATQVAGSAATRWYTQLSDGTNSPAIKPASTAAIATDPTLVVSVSPNNSVTVTQATAANLNATVTGTVELGSTSLAALENINVTIPGTVDLGTVSLTALETITVTSGTPNNFQSKVYGAVTTAAPTYTTATDNALSLTTNGALRVDVMSALPAGTNAIGKLTANDGVDIGDVTINNASIATTQSGTWTVGLSAAQTLGTVTNLAQLGGTAISMNTGVRDAGTQRVTIATNDSVPVTGTFWQATQPVSLASVPSHAVTNAGTFAVQVTSAPTTAVTGTFWQATQPVSGTVEIGATSLAALETINAAQSGTWTVQPGNTANTTPWLVKPAESLGTATALGALNAEITQALGGNLGSAATITATATPTGIVLTAYVSYDGGTNWTVTQFFNSANGDVINTLTSFTVGNAYSISAGDGATHIKVRATSWTSGSVTVRLSSSNSQGLVNLKATAVHDDPVGTFILQTGAFASSTAPTAVAVGDAVRLWATTSGALNIADGGGSVTVDGTVSVNALPAGTNNIGDVDILSIIPGTGATNLGKQTDSAAGATDTGVAVLAIRDDALTTLTPVDGDYTRVRVNSVGRLWASATIDTALPAGTNNIGDVDVLSLPALPTGTNTIGNVKVTDGTNSVAIKAASTSAAAADNAVVVTLSPNSKGYDATDDMLKVKSVQKKFRDSFPGAALNATNWDSVIGTGGSITVSGGNLNILSGITASAETSVTSKEVFTIPFRLSFQLTLSQRIANQTFIVEAISVNATTGVPDGLHTIAWVFDGTTVTQGKYRVQNSGLTPLDSAASTITTTAGTGVYEIEPFSDEAWFHTAILDSNAGRANSYRRHQQIPDPNAVYKLRLRWVNAATPPATTTTATLQFVQCQDYAELTAEITAGRGNIVAGQAMGVAITNVPNVSTLTTLSQFAGQAINLGAGTTATGTLRTIEASAATGTQTNPSLSTTSATLLAANVLRRAATIFNNSTSIVYVRLSATAASTTAFTIKLQADDYYEVPGNYNGAITAILNTGTTTAVQVTEIT